MKPNFEKSKRATTSADHSCNDPGVTTSDVMSRPYARSNRAYLFENAAFKSNRSPMDNLRHSVFPRTQIPSHQLLDGRYDEHSNKGGHQAMSQLKNTALLLVGMQNDHFGQESVLRASIEEPERIDQVKENILTMVKALQATDASIVNLPILFREGHPEITQEVGILAAIKQNGLFVDGSKGGGVISELEPLSENIKTLPGRTGFNTFVDTELNDYLTSHGIRHLLLAGASTAVCIDSTARSGYELGYDIIVLDDCTISRTPAEQEMYCTNIFPIYASVTSSTKWLDEHAVASGSA
tara:strand:+ start:2265 stop:3152 length:888 start_codon:yes stop_codon:yes gene_type:complete